MYSFRKEKESAFTLRKLLGLYCLYLVYYLYSNIHSFNTMLSINRTEPMIQARDTVVPSVESDGLDTGCIVTILSTEIYCMSLTSDSDRNTSLVTSIISELDTDGFVAYSPFAAIRDLYIIVDACRSVGDRYAFLLDLARPSDSRIVSPITTLTSIFKSSTILRMSTHCPVK